MASIEERFQAAVNVIKGLPKNGPYQPSTAMMLKFYGYYKQATEGPCQFKKPAFWDVVGKAKWDAWNDNRHLTKQQAMQKYVDGLREIIETMSFTENVQNFVGSISGLDNINLDELEMIAPGMRELAESHPSSPFNSRTNSPQHGVSTNHIAEELHGVPGMNGHTVKFNGNGDLSSNSNDTQESATPPPTPIDTMNLHSHSAPSYAATSLSNGIIDQSDDEYGDPVDMNLEITEAITKNTDIVKQIQTTVMRMNNDVLTLNQRVLSFEKALQEIRVQNAKSQVVNTTRVTRHYPKWWPFRNISPGWFAVLILWPFIMRRVSNMLTPQRRI